MNSQPSTPQPSTSDALLCRFAFEAPLVAGDAVMWMPAGTHKITPTQGGKGLTVEVQVDRSAAAAAQQQFSAVKAASGKRPYFDFNHEDREASFWPERFEWREQPVAGVYAIGEFSQAGAEGVSGKMWRNFSPVFYVDDTRAKPARIVARADAKPNMGGLVNDPAFASILPFWAKDAGAHPADQPQQQHNNNMTPQELAALQASIKTLETEVTALKAKASTDVGSASELKAKQSELKLAEAELRGAQLAAKNAELEAAEAKRREADADKAITEAIGRGAIAAKDDATKAHWKKVLVADPANVALLAAQAGPVMNGRTTPGASVQVTGTDPAHALKAYAGERHARQRGAIYAREIGPLLAKGAGLVGLDSLRPQGDGPIEATNSFGTLVGNIISQRVLELLRFQLPALNRITTDFSDQQVKYSQSILTRYIGIPAVGTYNTSTGYPAISDAAATDVTVAINQHKCVELDLQAEQLSGTARRLFDEQVPAMSYALAKDLVDYVYALITAANFTNTATQSAVIDFGRGKLVDMSKALTDRGVPGGSANRTLLLNTAMFAQLQKDASIIQLATFQRPEFIQENQLPPVGGFMVIEAANLPSTGSLAGFGMGKSALVAATRLPMDYSSILPGAANGSVNAVTDPDTGASMMQVAYVNHTLGTANFRLAWMYGAAKGQINAGQLLTN